MRSELVSPSHINRRSGGQFGIVSDLIEEVAQNLNDESARENQRMAVEQKIGIAGDTRFVPGALQTFPFQFTVPSRYLPTVEGIAEGATGWEIKVTLSRRLRSEGLLRNAWRNTRRGHKSSK
ncbi:MAG: hypothetical protein NTU41_02385 [Chloroflexi bacterium]|nr:hypothetical protein [Chloroflexota bacterium]